MIQGIFFNKGLLEALGTTYVHPKSLNRGTLGELGPTPEACSFRLGLVRTPRAWRPKALLLHGSSRIHEVSTRDLKGFFKGDRADIDIDVVALNIQLDRLALRVFKPGNRVIRDAQPKQTSNYLYNEVSRYQSPVFGVSKPRNLLIQGLWL